MWQYVRPSGDFTDYSVGVPIYTDNTNSRLFINEVTTANIPHIFELEYTMKATAPHGQRLFFDAGGGYNMPGPGDMARAGGGFNMETLSQGMAMSMARAARALPESGMIRMTTSSRCGRSGLK